MLGSRSKGIVLAGTYHSAGSSFERLIARPLLPIVQTPLIGYSLQWLHGGGVTSATICANSATRGVRAFLDSGPPSPLALDYYEDWTPRGPAGCVRDAGARCDADTLVVADSTAIPTVNLRELLEAHERSGAAVTIVAYHDPARGANADALLGPAGIYVFARRVLDFIPDRGFHDIKENVVSRLHDSRERVVVYPIPGKCLRILNAESYLAVNEWMVGRASQWKGLLEGYESRGETAAHPTARIDPSAVLMGPVVVGPNTTIARDALVVGPATIGPGTTVGEGAIISRSVVWSRCTIGRGAVIDRCLLADDVLVEPRAVLFRALEAPRRRLLRSLGRAFGERILGVGRRRMPPASLPLPDRLSSG